MPDFQLDRPATPEEAAAIAAAVAAYVATDVVEAPAPVASPWRTAARLESLGIVRRIPGQLDMRYIGSATRERLTRAGRQGLAQD
ncbi:MAG: hypothetical protein ACK46X_09790 [Candidatus Sericytochromatia bacterium]